MVQSVDYSEADVCLFKIYSDGCLLTKDLFQLVALCVSSFSSPSRSPDVINRHLEASTVTSLIVAKSSFSASRQFIRDEKKKEKKKKETAVR